MKTKTRVLVRPLIMAGVICVFATAKLNGQSYFVIDFSGSGAAPDNVFVENLTQNTSLSMPGTDTLHLIYSLVHIPEVEYIDNTFNVYPNPMEHSCSFEFMNARHGRVIIQLFSMDGRILYQYSEDLATGKHGFMLSGVQAGIYVIGVKTPTGHFAGRFVSVGGTGANLSLVHTSHSPLKFSENTQEIIPDISETQSNLKNTRAIIDMNFAIGDQLKFVGYSAGFENDTVLFSPAGDTTLTFDFVAAFQCGVTMVTFMYNGTQVTYGTVSGQNNTCWLDRNLGAQQVATASNDYLAYGDLFQWGRAADEHQLIVWSSFNGVPVHGTTVNACDAVSTDTVGHSLFIKCNTAPFDWRNPQNSSLWQGVYGINNPCPDGWRIPTNAELDAERLVWSTIDVAGAFASELKLPAAGYRNSSTAGFGVTGSYGYYWSSSNSAPLSSVLKIEPTNAFIGSQERATGFSVRCIKD